VRRTIIVGDVHGCVDELYDLLRACDVCSSDRLILVGDLVAKGPDSRGVIALARERKAESVRGNHDEAVLRVHRARREGRELPRVKALHQRVADSLSAADWEYLEAMPLFLPVRDQNVLVVHAGVVPDCPLERQEEQHLLNMRSIREDGSASARLEEGVRWAERYRGPQHVVFGHDAITGLQRHPHATGLDTGCVYGRALTALILPEHRLVSVPAHRVYQELRT
jgi:predicted phosphodiesterase